MGWIENLVALDACKPAIAWCRTQPSFEAAWAACERGDWLIWVAVTLGVDNKLVVRATCACVRPALQYVPAGEDRPRVAIETAEAWTRGEATDEQVRAAAYAACYAAAAIRADNNLVESAASRATDAAANVARYGDGAICAAARAAGPAEAVMLQRSAEIVRSLIGCPKL